jgi:hypothetical protein
MVLRPVSIHGVADRAASVDGGVRRSSHGTAASASTVRRPRDAPERTANLAAPDDTTIDQYPQACATRGETLTTAMATGHVARQVYDLSEPQPLIVTEHRAHGCRCLACGTQTRAAFPEGVAAPRNTASGSEPWCSICCPTNCCPRSVWLR